MSDEQPIVNINDLGATHWTLAVTNDWSCEDVYMSRWSPDFATFEIEASFDVDSDTYERLLAMHPEPVVTVEHITDHNPWHRTASGSRAVARKIVDGIWWTFRKRVLRRGLIETTKVTVPNCRIGLEP